MGRFLDFALLREQPTIGQLSDADRLDLLWRFDPALLYPVAVRKSLRIVESSRFEFELYRRAEPPGLGDGLLVCLHPERLTTFEAVVVLKADSQAAVSVRFEPCHFQFPPRILEAGRVSFARLELPRPERRPMDQKTPLDNKKTVRLADFARRNPAIDRLSVTPNHLRKFGYCQVLTRCRSCLDHLSAHDRLSSR